GAEDQCHREERARGHRLVQDQPTEQHSDHGIHVRVGAHDGGRGVTQGVGIRAIAQDRAEHHKVGDCTDAFRREVPPAPLTEQRANGTAPTYGLVSVRCRLLYTEPSDHEALAHVRAIGPRRSARRISAGLAPTRRAVPRKPSRSPVTTRQFKSPEPPGMTASKNAIHRATVTTKMLAMPEAV